MLKIIRITLLIIFLITILLFIYCSLVLASRVDEEQYKQ